MTGWVEQLDTVDTIGGDGRLPFGTSQPSNERPAPVGVYMPMARRIDQNHTIRVEKPSISFDQHAETPLVSKSHPGRPVGQRVSPHPDGK